MVRQSPKCSKGFPCGKACISRSRLCWANLSSSNNKVAETFSQFVNRLVGVKTPIETGSPNRKDIINSVNSDDIKKIIKDLSPNYERNTTSEIDEIRDLFKENPPSKEDVIILGAYADTEYIEINDFLREKKISRGILNSQNRIEEVELEENSNEMKEIAAKVVAMDKAYDGLNNITEKKVLYRGISGKNQLFDNLKPGDTYSDKGYGSSSPNRSIAESFAEGSESIILKIEMSPPTNNVKDLGRLNTFDEEEYLINKDTEFEVVSVDTINGIKELTLREKTFNINQELKDENYIGGGVYGSVYKTDDPDVVIKQGQIGEDEARIPKKLEELGFQNGIKIIGVSPNRMAMKKINGVPIELLSPDVLEENKPKILAAMKKMGELGVAHNDIHAGNILIDANTGEVNIVDFGLAEDSETQFIDGPNPQSNLRRNILKDGVKTLSILKDNQKLESMIAFLNTKLGIDNINDIIKLFNSYRFEKMMKDESLFKEIFEFIYS